MAKLPVEAAPASGLLSLSQTVEQLRSEPKRFAGSADAPTLAALAKRFELLSLDRLDYKFDTTPWRDGVKLDGTISASLTQSCVSTMEPVAQSIDEPFLRGYLPFKTLYPDARPNAEHELAEDPALGDVPDILVDPLIMGEVLAEVLGLAIDPWPRADGAEPVEESAAPVGVEPLTEETVKPFASLKALKDKLEGGS